MDAAAGTGGRIADHERIGQLREVHGRVVFAIVVAGNRNAARRFLCRRVVADNRVLHLAAPNRHGAALALGVAAARVVFDDQPVGRAARDDQRPARMALDLVAGEIGIDNEAAAHERPAARDARLVRREGAVGGDAAPHVETCAMSEAVALVGIALVLVKRAAGDKAAKLLDCAVVGLIVVLDQAIADRAEVEPHRRTAVVVRPVVARHVDAGERHVLDDRILVRDAKQSVDAC